MSGIYIPNVAIPKEHNLYITLRPDGSIHVWDSYEGVGFGTQATPVPDHGDLIDARALIASCKNEKGSYFSYESAIIGEAVERAPAIIPGR